MYNHNQQYTHGFTFRLHNFAYITLELDYQVKQFWDYLKLELINLLGLKIGRLIRAKNRSLSGRRRSTIE